MAPRGTAAAGAHEARGAPEAAAAGHGMYQVWHDAGWPVRADLNARFGVETPFPAGFVHVADVPAASLGEAVALTTGPGGAAAPPGDFGRRPGTPDRDTQAGDIIVDPQGRPHRYEGRGFRAIDAANGPGWPDPARRAHFRRDPGRGAAR